MIKKNTKNIRQNLKASSNLCDGWAVKFGMGGVPR